MKLGVCVPYRNREAHLKEFIPKVGAYLESKGIDYCMYFAHQVDDKLFNRGATKNVAAKHAFEDGCDYIVCVIYYCCIRCRSCGCFIHSYYSIEATRRGVSLIF